MKKKRTTENLRRFYTYIYTGTIYSVDFLFVSDKTKFIFGL